MKTEGVRTEEGPVQPPFLIQFGQPLLDADVNGGMRRGTDGVGAHLSLGATRVTKVERETTDDD